MKKKLSTEVFPTYPHNNIRSILPFRKSYVKQKSKEKTEFFSCRRRNAQKPLPRGGRGQHLSARSGLNREAKFTIADFCMQPVAGGGPALEQELRRGVLQAVLHPAPQRTRAELSVRAAARAAAPAPGSARL